MGYNTIMDMFLFVKYHLNPVIDSKIIFTKNLYWDKKLSANIKSP